MSEHEMILDFLIAMSNKDIFLYKDKEVASGVLLLKEYIKDKEGA